MSRSQAANLELTWCESEEFIDWQELALLYKLAPLGDKDPSDLKTVFSNSRFKFFVFEGRKLCAAGRALADGADCSYICDVAVHPEYQGSGLGKAIVSKLVAASQGHKKIILYAVPSKVDFYHALGFKRMCTAMAIFAREDNAVAMGLITRD